MAVTRVTNTRDGLSAIRYVLEEQKKGKERVLMASGSNLDPKFAAMQMKAVWDAYGKNNGESVQVYRLIQSFGLDELDPNNQEDIAKSNEIGQLLANELYPDKQALIVTQADGEGGKLHNHIIVNSVGFTDGKSLRGYRKEWSAIADKSDEIIQRYGLDPIEKKGVADRRTIAERKVSDKGGYVWKDDLKGRIRSTLERGDVESQDDFITRMDDEFGVDVRFRGKGVSYAFKDDDGKNRRIRANRLGNDFGKDTLHEIFQDNLIRREREEKERKERLREMLSQYMPTSEHGKLKDDRFLDYYSSSFQLTDKNESSHERVLSAIDSAGKMLREDERQEKQHNEDVQSHIEQDGPQL